MKKDELIYITVLRGFASLWVVAHHAMSAYGNDLLQFPSYISSFLWKGWIGVDLFFILSGFIIAYNYNERFETFSFSKSRDFWWKRFIRLYPAHLFVMIAFLAFIFLATKVGVFVDAENKFTIANFLPQVFLISGWGFSFTKGHFWNVPVWSVSAEVLAYMSFPFFAVGIKRLKSLKINTIVLISTIGFYILIAENFNSLLDDGTKKFIPVHELTSFRVLIEFIIGMLTFKIFERVKLSNMTASLTAILTLALVTLTAVFLPPRHDYIYIFLFPYLIIALSFIKSYTPSLKLFKFLGEASYSIYLVHMLVLIIIRGITKKIPFIADTPQIGFFLSIVFGAIAGCLIYKLVENPARKFLLKLKK